MFLLQKFIIISLISMIISITTLGDAYNQFQDDQKTLLLDLKNNLSFKSSVSRKLVRWNESDDCCEWEGVGCDAAGHVRSLKLDYEGISGGVENSSSLVSLEYLEELNLAHNSLNGTIPTLNLPNLVELDLSSNSLYGPIYDSFFIHLHSLEVLSLSNNSFNGTFRLENFQSLHNLTALYLSYNNLSLDESSIDSNWSSFSQLKELSLASCNLNKLPDFIMESNLNYLDLSNNKIRGEIPSWIWEIGTEGLYHLNLSHNLFVDLQMPYHIPGSLAELDLHSNQLQGELPLLPRSASYVDFSTNQFDKPIPLNLVSSNLFLIFLSIANNGINGSIPTCICSAESIQVLDLSLNNLSGSIPPCVVERMYNLQMLNLRGNNLSGDIPDKFSSGCALRILDLSSNNLGGIFPKFLPNCTSLEFVNVKHNSIEGRFPCLLPSRLKILVLRSNRFLGEVTCGESWPNLQIIDIASNNFSGDLHHIRFSSLKTMVGKKYDYAMKHNLGINVGRPDFNYLTQVVLTIKGSQSLFPHFFSSLTLLDFSSNNFQGEIPEAIGDLSSLHFLNLSHNDFTGTIPKSIGKMEVLEALDLSVNHLTETIPAELENLTFLSIVNLSYNKLVGRIPSGQQFATFENYSYVGNAGLCGVPLTSTCSINDAAATWKLGDGINHAAAAQLPHGNLPFICFIYFLAFIYY